MRAFIVAAVACLALCSVASASGKHDVSALRHSMIKLVADKQLVSSFFSFMTQFNKTYSSLDEAMIRLANFKVAIARAKQLEESSGNQGVYGITKFSDMSQTEFESTMLTFRVPDFEEQPPQHEDVPSKYGNPAALDWRTVTPARVTPVKDQGQCGSCWAFSATESIESAWAAAHNQLYTLAPQQIVSCDTGDGNLGCNGGWPDVAMTWVSKSGGMVTESSFPYHSGTDKQTGACTVSSSAPRPVTVSASRPFTAVGSYCRSTDCTSQDETVVENALVSVGPLSICLNAETFNSYVSGVIMYNCPNGIYSVDHCVQLVGYNNNSNPPYWIVRNSWNTNWGNAGYVYIAKGKGNVCGIVDRVSYATAA